MLQKTAVVDMKGEQIGEMQRGRRWISPDEKYTIRADFRKMYLNDKWVADIDVSYLCWFKDSSHFVLPNNTNKTLELWDVSTMKPLKLGDRES